VLAPEIVGIGTVGAGSELGDGTNTILEIDVWRMHAEFSVVFLAALLTCGVLREAPVRIEVSSINGRFQREMTR
jgi:hypothetical protein